MPTLGPRSGGDAHELRRWPTKAGLPERVLAELFAGREPGFDDAPEAFQEERREMLSPSQRRAVLDFVSILRRHRPEEFYEDELDSVEEALDR